MATGLLKRGDTEPSPQLLLKASDGADYDLTNHSVYMTMILPTTLSTTMNDSVATIDLPASIVDVVEVNDIVLIHHERIQIDAPLPTQPIAAAEATFQCTRGVDEAAIAGAVVGSLDVAGTGANVYRLGTNAVFTLTVDLGTPTVVTVLATETTTNTTIGHLVTDIQTAVDLALGGGVATVSNQNDKVVITSDTTGAASNMQLTSPDAIALAELGVVAAYGQGVAAKTTDAEAHDSGDVARLIKIDHRTAIIENPATEGSITFEWLTGDTDRIATYFLEFEVTTPQNKIFTVPTDDSFSVAVVADYEDR